MKTTIFPEKAHDFVKATIEAWAKLDSLVTEIENGDNSHANEVAELAKFCRGKGDNLDYLAQIAKEAVNPTTIDTFLHERFPDYQPAVEPERPQPVQVKPGEIPLRRW